MARTHEADDIGVDERVDFVNAFWMVHETPNAKDLLRQVSSCLRPGGHLFVAEPKAHVSPEEFQRMIETAKALGLAPADEPRVRFSRAVVFSKENGSEGAGRPAALDG